jgi:asparagine synthase (glutamine-hydrolysing)
MFNTKNSDTEVVLLSYIEWGWWCVHRFNGIYALAIWDEGHQKLFMARDRLGVKPLFYSVKNNSLIFGSEIKSLLAHPLVKPVVKEEGLAELLLLGPSRTPGTAVFSDIKELRAGQVLSFDKSKVQINTYWRLESHEHEDDLDSTIGNIRYLLEDTVSRQLSADVPVCTLLSGGLDSSGLSALAVKNKGSIETYSVDYADNHKHFQPSLFQPESDAFYAQQAANYLNTSHHSIILDNTELAHALLPSLYANDLPGMADIDSSLLLFSKEIKKKFVVALSGECADEVFGGYPWFHDTKTMLQNTFPWIRLVDEKLKYLNSDVINAIKPYEFIQTNYRNALEEVPQLSNETAAQQRLRQIAYLSITRFMPTLLDRKDRMSMACGLEVRVPFSDHRLVEYVWNIPWDMKNCDGMAKGILRRALSDLLPKEIIYRRKSPYPKTYNPIYYNSVKNKLTDILNEPGSPLLKIINKKELQDKLENNDHVFSQPWFGQLMGDTQYLAFLYQLNEWMKDYQVIIS